MKKIIIGGLVALAVLGVWFFGFRDHTTMNAKDIAQYDAAVAVLDDIRSYTPRQRQKDVLAAGENLDILIEKYPEMPRLHYQKARVYIFYGIALEDRGKFNFMLGQADEELKLSLEIDPKFADAYVLYGIMYYNVGNEEAAHEALDIAETLGADGPWLYLNRAVAFTAQKEFDKARPLYQKIYDSDTTNIKAKRTALIGLRDYYIWERNVEMIDKSYLEEIALEPRAAGAYTKYAKRLLCQNRDLDKSIEYSKQALAQNEDFEESRRWYAAALYLKWTDTVDVKNPVFNEDYYKAFEIYPYPGKYQQHNSCLEMSMVANMVEWTHEFTRKDDPKSMEPAKNLR